MAGEERLAVVALGSNLGDRLAMLRRAAEELASLGALVARSRVYETAPVGPAQPDYANAIVLLRTALEPEALLEALLGIERRLGRVRAERWGPRTIDLDLVALGRERRAGPSLVLPHPEAHRRAFVLAPLCDVAPDLELPGAGRARDLFASLPPADRAGVRPLTNAW